MIDGIKRQLHQQVQTAFDQIARLTEAKQQLIRVGLTISIVNNNDDDLFRIYKINTQHLPFVKRIYN